MTPADRWRRGIGDPDAMQLAWAALLRLLDKVAPGYRTEHQTGDMTGSCCTVVQLSSVTRAPMIESRSMSPMNQEARFSRMEPELRKANLIEATLGA
jgi:hypothetical protein